MRSLIANCYSFLPNKAYAKELVRPWKLVTFSIAMSWLLYGALNYEINDWDVGVTLLMGSLTYMLAPWSVYVIYSSVRYRQKRWFLHIVSALIAALFVVDWVYVAYHSLMENQTYRDANFYASLPLYFMAGTVWLYRGSVKALVDNIKKLGHEIFK